MRPHREHGLAPAVWPHRPAVEVEATGPIAEPVPADVLRDVHRPLELARRRLEPDHDLRWLVALALRRGPHAWRELDVDDVTLADLGSREMRHAERREGAGERQPE